MEIRRLSWTTQPPLGPIARKQPRGDHVKRQPQSDISGADPYARDELCTGRQLMVKTDDGPEVCEAQLTNELSLCA
jgi:hypothetical protein